MGCTAEIDETKYPKQGEYKGKWVHVCFHYRTEQAVRGKVIRDDMTAPFRTVIELEDGRVVLGDECQWSYLLTTFRR